MVKKEFGEKGAMADLMVRTTKKLWGTGEVVEMDSRFCVLEGLISMDGKCVLGSELIKKRRYWPKGVPVEEILPHIQNKEVGDVNAVKESIRGEIYHTMSIEDPDDVVLMMTTYGMLEHLEVSDAHRRYKGVGGELVTKRFKYCEVYGNNFEYRHQV